MKTFSTALCCLLLCVVFASVAVGQQPYQRYQSPYGPTLAPELNYFRRDPGALSNYQTFVRPQRQLRSSLQNLRSSVARQQNQLRTLQQGVPTQPKTHATFLNYSHFYTLPTR